MGAAKKQKKKAGSASGRQGQAGAADATVAAYDRFFRTLGALETPGTAAEAARAVRAATLIMAKPSGAACFFEVISCLSAHSFDAAMAQHKHGTPRCQDRRLTA